MEVATQLGILPMPIIMYGNMMAKGGGGLSSVAECLVYVLSMSCPCLVYILSISFLCLVYVLFMSCLCLVYVLSM